MDFTFNEVQNDIRSLTEEILSERLTLQRFKELESSAEVLDRDIWSEFAKANLLGLSLPEDVGGSGLGIMEACVVLEQVGRHVAPIPYLSTVVSAAMTIAQFGTAEQKKQYLAPVVEGTSLITAALEEPRNSDPLNASTAATREGSRWRLHGEKISVPYGGLADRILLVARTEQGPGVFLLDPSAEGVSLEPTVGTNHEPQANLSISRAIVEGEDLLGDPSNEVAAWLYEHTLAGICATAAGLFDRAVRITAEYISSREQFGKPIATFQGATLKAADAYIDAQMIGICAWSAIWRLAEGRPARDELHMAKFWAADAGQRIAYACQHLHGGIGVDVDYPIHRYFLWAKQLELTLGGSSAHLLSLGSSLADGK